MFSLIFFLSYYFLQRLFSPSTKINTPNIFYLFFRSLAIFSRSKYSPLRVFILQICFFPNTSLPQVYSIPTSLPFYSSLSGYLPCNNFFSQCISTTTILSPKNIYLPWILFLSLFFSSFSWRLPPSHLSPLQPYFYVLIISPMKFLFPKTFPPRLFFIRVILSPSLFPLLRLPTLISINSGQFILPYTSRECFFSFGCIYFIFLVFFSNLYPLQRHFSPRMVSFRSEYSLIPSILHQQLVEAFPFPISSILFHSSVLPVRLYS